MRALLFAHGTRGDIQPFVALGQALNAAGHEAVLAATAGLAPLAQAHGVCFFPLRSGNDLLKDPAIQTGFQNNFRGLRGKIVLARCAARSREKFTRVFTDMAATVELKPDIVVHQPGLPANAIAELLDVPSVPAALEPHLVPTATFPNPVMPVRVPRYLNRLTYAATRSWIRVFQGSPSRWRREHLGLGYRLGQSNPLLAPDGGPATVLQAFSRTILPDPVDYPSWVHTTGFWFLSDLEGWRPPGHLLDFLERGPAPVYVGFGSSIGTDPRRTGSLVVEAVRKAGVRAVVVGGSGGIQTEVDDDICLIQQAPFDWLFPRMRALVHHGGSGTTGAALAAGRPQVVCPYIVSQRYFATRMHSIGVAPPPLPQSTIDASGLSDAIRRAVDDPALSQQASQVGRAVRAEGGVAEAVRILEGLA